MPKIGGPPGNAGAGHEQASWMRLQAAARFEISMQDLYIG